MRNCKNCGNFFLTSKSRSNSNRQEIFVSQALKDNKKFLFSPDANPLDIMSTMRKYDKDLDNKLNSLMASQTFNSDARYLIYRRKTINTLISSSDRFNFTSETKHFAITLFDCILMQENLDHWIPSCLISVSPSEDTFSSFSGNKSDALNCLK